MSIVFYIFCFCIFLVELPVIYSPLYYVSFKVLSIDKKLGDKYVSLALLVITLVLSILLFPFAFSAVSRIIG
jgi:hypothetical protein